MTNAITIALFGIPITIPIPYREKELLEFFSIRAHSDLDLRTRRGYCASAFRSFLFDNRQFHFFIVGNTRIRKNGRGQRIPELKSAAVHKAKVGSQRLVYKICRGSIPVFLQCPVEIAGHGHISSGVQRHKDDGDARVENNIRGSRVNVDVPLGVFMTL